MAGIEYGPGTVQGASADTLSAMDYRNGINSLRLAILEGSTVLNNGKTLEDVFTDETGVNTGTSTATYNASEDKYGNEANDNNTIIRSNTTDGSTTFTDLVNSKTVTPFGDVQHDDSLGATGDAFGGATTSIVFDGTGDFLQIADSDDFNFGSGDWTVQAWVRPADVSANKAIVGQWESGQKCFYLRRSGTGLQMLLSTDGSAETIYSTSSSTLSINTWHHVAVVRNGNNMNIYLDGVQDATTHDLTGVTLYNPTGVFKVGSVQSAEYWNGHMDDIAIAKTAIYTTGFTPPTDFLSTGGEDFLLQATAYSTSSDPTEAKIVLLHEPIDSVTLNTDLTAEVSRDGGTTWSSFTLESYSAFLASATVNILVADPVSLVGQPSGTSLLWRINSANSKTQNIHGAYLQWSE